MKTGLVSVSFRGLSPEQIMRECVKCNIAAIEWGSDVHAKPDEPDRLCELAKMQDSFGIICSSYGTYFRIGESKPDEIYAYINAARILGTDILRIWCGNKASDKYSEEESKELIHACRELAGIAEREKVKLCTEFHRGTFTDSADRVTELCESVNSKHFATYWQPNQYRSLEENLAGARKLSRLVQNIHVFNWKGKNRYPLADASEAWYNYLSCFSGEHYALLEFMPDGKIESLAREAEALRALLEDLE